MAGDEHMTRVVKITLVGVAAVLLVGLVVVAPAIYRNLNPHKHKFSVPAESELTEELAVDLTRQTLEAEGFNVNDIIPLAWGSREYKGKPEQFLARNTIDPDEGYVLWNCGDSGWRSVWIEKKQHEAVCQAFRCK